MFSLSLVPDLPTSTRPIWRPKITARKQARRTLEHSFLSSKMTSSGYRQGAAESELWSDFEKAIQEGNEARVRQILESNATSSGKKSSFLTRKIVRRQVRLQS